MCALDDGQVTDARTEVSPHTRETVITGGPHIPTPAVASAPPEFSIAVKPQRETVEVSPIGELDLETTPQLQSELEKLIDAGFARIVIDLRRVAFLDSTALHALLSAHTCAERDGWDLAIIPGPRAVQRIFELTRAVDHLPFITVDGKVTN